jgi:hypothetical protein
LLPLHIESKIIADNSSMPLEVYRLENSFDSIEKSEFDGNSYIQAAIHDTTETLNIDISKYISVWLKDEDSNYGLMIKPYNNNNSLQQFKFSLPESLNVTYTTLPEIE